MISGRFARFAGVTLTLVALASSGSAQTVSDALTFLMTNQSVQTGDFERDRTAAEATSETISRAILANLATLPVATSSSGFLYRLNPELGTVERATQSFGPFFVERALTAGRHQASIGLTFQQLRFESLDGRNLRDGSLVTTANQFVDEAAPFDVDRLTLNIDARIATLYGNVGVTDRLEVGFAVPMVDLSLDGTRANTYRGRTFTQASATARSIGFADIVARTKVTLYSEDGAGHIETVTAAHPTLRQVETIRLVPDAAGLNMITVVPGFKWNLSDTWVLAGNVSMPVTSGGLTTRFTPFVGVDYAVGR